MKTRKEPDCLFLSFSFQPYTNDHVSPLSCNAQLMMILSGTKVWSMRIVLAADF